jgi:hypothetical protein
MSMIRAEWVAMSSRVYDRRTTGGRGGALGEREAGTPLGCRPDRPRREAAAAVGTDVVELTLDAVGAERALVAADARVDRSWGQVLVAELAVGTQLQRHDSPRVVERLTGVVEPRAVPAHAAVVEVQRAVLHE